MFFESPSLSVGFFFVFCILMAFVADWVLDLDVGNDAFWTGTLLLFLSTTFETFFLMNSFD